MNTLNTFKILFGCELIDNKLKLPNNFNLLQIDKHIRELVYLYFGLIEHNIYNNTLTFDKIAEYINNDIDFPIIPNTIDPEIFYNKHITLSKYFKFDADFLESLNVNSKNSRVVPRYCVKYCFNSNEFWNINNYLESQAISINEAAQFKHASEVVDFDFITLKPDLFDIDIIYQRFKKEIKPKYFENETNKIKYILKILKEFKKEKYTDDYFISNYDVLLELFNAETKRLPYNFDEIVLNLNNDENIKYICNEYVKWLVNNFKNEYIFDKLLIRASNINELFKKGFKKRFK